MKQITYRTSTKMHFYILLTCLNFSLVSFAQTIDPAAQALIDAKMNKVASMNWQTQLGKINPQSGVLITGPAQDCPGGIDVCAQSYTQSVSYTGPGNTQEVNGTCLLGQETNSVWYIFTAQTSGNFGFTLSTVKDYDFALYNITTTGCAGVPTAAPIRCNFSATLGNTGMVPTGTCTSCSASQSPFSSELAVTAGQTYALIVDNWSADANGYVLNFTTGAGYASITDVTPPTINPPNTVVNNCNGTFTLVFSEAVKCSSISTVAPFDFTLSSGSITGVTGVGCTGATLTNSVTITYTVPTSGTFTLGVQSGSDGNTILDKCGNAMVNTQTLTLNVLNSLTLTPSVTNICNAGTAVTLTASGAPNSTGTYTLNPGGLTGAANGSGQYVFTVNPNATTTYVVNMTYGGCTGSASTTITLANNIVVAINPVNPTICSGTAVLTAATTVNGTADPGATFLWSPGGATTASISGNPGTTYSVTTISSGGCAGTNTATSTPNLASAGSGTSCNIYYVNSYNGAGTCLTKSSPGGLVTALALAACQNAIIKMAVGVYTFTNTASVSSNVTIEGGYNSTFTTKTSNMSGGVNSTTIQRTSTPDGGSGTKVSAFDVAASSTGFRFQDLRIEMPDLNVSTTLPSGYCSSAGTTSTAGYIKLVSMGAIFNPSDFDGYVNTGLSTVVTQGGTYNLNMTYHVNNAYSVFTEAWIDWNGNGSFADAGEIIMTSSNTNTAGDFSRAVAVTVPAGATAGTTKMRVFFKYNAAISADGCDNGTIYEDVEDYNIVIFPSTYTVKSNYAIYIGNGCSGYNIVRCYIDAGKGSKGLSGTDGTNGGVAGAVGNNATTTGGAGVGSGAQAGGAGGNGGTSGTPNGTAGSNGGAGALGGANGTGVNATLNASACWIGLPYSGTDGADGAIGGTPGATGAAGTYSGGLYVVGGQGGTGTGGSGGGGGGGGGGGYNAQGSGTVGGGGGGGGAGGTFTGTCGTGAFGGGGSFGIFQYNSTGTITDCYITTKGGAGGQGGAAYGGAGGTGGRPGCYAKGLVGGYGGNGGTGGCISGNGATGASIPVGVLNAAGTTYATSAFTNFYLTIQSVMLAGDATNINTNCINTNMNMTTAAGSPDWTGSAAPLTGTGSPKTVSYTTTGRKDVVLLPAASGTGTLVTQGFNSTSIPAGWNSAIILNGSPSPALTYVASSTAPTIAAPAEGSDYVHFNSFSCPTGSKIRLYQTSSFNSVGYTGINVNFSWHEDLNYNYPSEGVTVQWSTDGSTWTNSTFFQRYNAAETASGTWHSVSAALPAGANNQPILYIAFLFTSAYGYNCDLDGVTVTGSYAASSSYSGFNNMMMSPPSAGSILGINPLCPNISGNFSSSVAGTPGFTYSWTVTNPAGGTSTVASPTASTTGIVFTNSTASAITFTVNEAVSSECCGLLSPSPSFTVSVSPSPATPTVTASPNPICPSATSTLTATPPASCSIQWYNASSGGTLLSSGPTYAVTPAVTTTYYAQAVSSIGCPGPRTAIEVTVTPTAAPTVPNVNVCTAGTLTLSVSSPIAGATYNWSSTCGGAALQSSVSTNFTVSIPSVQTNTYYVTATVSGCAASACTAVTAQVSAAPASVFWTGAGTTGLNNWFDGNNWASGGQAATTFATTVASAGLSTSNCGGNETNVITVSGYTSTVVSTSITINVTTTSHAKMTDVSMFLTAPNGQILGLTNHKGVGGACAFSNITFSDAAAGVMTNTVCPASGSSFKPETATYGAYCGVTSTITSFGAFGGGAYNPNGNWTLTLTDNVNSNGGAAIAIGGWSISFPSNLTGQCAPTCATNVTIPATPALAVSNPPDIGFSGSVAATNDITLAAGNTLSFSDSKAQLNVCGNFIHAGNFKTSNSTNGFSLGKVVFTGSAAQTYANSNANSIANNFFNDVIINNSAASPNDKVSLTTNNMTLGTGGTFSFQKGKLYTLSTNTLVITNTAPAAMSGYSATTGFVCGTTNGEGNLERYLQAPALLGSYDFPVGLDWGGSAHYERDSIDFQVAPTSPITWLCAHFNRYPGAAPIGPAFTDAACNLSYNNQVLDNGFWTITANNSFNNTGLYNMVLFNTGYTNANAGFTIMTEHNGSATWGILNGDGTNGVCGSVPVTWVWRGDMNGFSNFGTAQSAVLLPVELLSFRAQYNGKSVDVTWSTGSEINCNHFDVEKSLDGVHFSFLKQVKTKAPGGNSSYTLNYAINDPDVNSGTYYYRLKQFDNNGKGTYSPQVQVTITGASNVVDNTVFTVKPNPTTETAEVSYQCNSTENATLKVYDDRGRLVMSKEMICQKGPNSVVIDLNEHPEGMYFIVLSVSDNVYKTKLIKINPGK